ncbi:hypothetical protein EHQ16_03185 [Leptospira kanakyensis]|uniref:Uncharacterized protein n=1 Tax=Leptospira kanakyensis TaxID=2484968 RepID=A0A6N4Q7W2_9LEPT|nr:hypothetical protein [Leptospira kanakyensis]TGK47526.1 hypothetical protein EHQ11_16445 [Leptospira kanakyensis]TGK63471.1 hypothetical protein EHQ16_03185 [Leptospira kanakyensis]TGK67075.1 hypothetical protein EHQ18_18425 [Leptospira kanakyensis]
MFAFVFIAFLNPIVLVYDLWNNSLAWVYTNYFSDYKDRLVDVCPHLGTIPSSEKVDKALMQGEEAKPEKYKRIYVEDHRGRTMHYAKIFVSDVKNINNPGELSWFLREYKDICGLDRPPYYEEIEYIKNARANGTELPKALE